MNTYVLYTRSGKRYFVQAPWSSRAVEWLERHMGERVMSWDVAYSVPCGTPVLSPIC